MANSKIKINLDSLKTRREWHRHKVKDGHNIFRVLPPFGEQSNGYPYRKWQIIWGLADPETGRVRPFASSMMNEKRCPVTEYVNQLKTKVEQAKSTLQAAGFKEDAVKARLACLYKTISDLAPKTIYIYNASDKAGEVGLLELKSTAHKKMKIEMNQYVHDYNQDPTSLNSADDDSGVWFDVTRTGLGRDTEYDVKKCQQKVRTAQGKVTFEDDRSPLADGVVENYDNLAYDLHAVYQTKSYDELNDALQANMPGIIEGCPDADLDAEITIDVPQVTIEQPRSAKSLYPTSTATSATAPRPTKVMAARFDDEDEDLPPARGTGYKMSAPAASTAAMDDDFLRQADELLKS